MMYDSTRNALLDLYGAQAKAQASAIADLQEQLIERMAMLESIALAAYHLHDGEDEQVFRKWCHDNKIFKDRLEMCANSVGIDPVLYDNVIEPKGKAKK